MYTNCTESLEVNETLTEWPLNQNMPGVLFQKVEETTNWNWFNWGMSNYRHNNIGMQLPLECSIRTPETPQNY